MEPGRPLVGQYRPRNRVQCQWLFAVFLLAAPLALEAQDHFSSDLERALGSIVEGLLDEVPAAGLAVGVVQGDRVIHAQGYGVTDLETRAPVTPETLFQIGSVSKSFTATLAARLVERGRLGWDRPVSAHLWNGALAGSGITLAQLGSHQAGLPRDAPGLRRLHGDYPVLAFTHFELYRGLRDLEPAFPPGSSWSYSNFGYGVLGHVLEIATDTPYEVLLQREIFEPLEMTASTVTIWPERKGALATPYSHDEEGRLVEYTPWDPEALAPASGVASNVRDLARYLSFHLRESQRGGAVATTHAARGTVNGNLDYGIGWFSEELPGVGRLVSVGGDLDGYLAEIAFSPEIEIGVILLANSDPAGPIPELGRWILASMRAGADAEAARDATFRRAMIHQGLKQWAEAVGHFERLVSGAEPHAAALYQLGRTGALSGQHLEKAEAALLRYLELEPDAALPAEAARWRLGNVYERMNRCRDAEAQYRAAAEKDYGPAEDALRQLDC